jgi:hypothetical protein
MSSGIQSTNYLEYRSPDDLHGEFIASTRPKSDDEEFIRLVKEVFGHQRAVFGEVARGDGIGARAKRFYGGYVPPRLAKGTDPEHGTTLEPDEAFRLFFLSPEAVNRNIVFFLIGDVGVGKSSFVNWLITERAEQSTRRSQCWFVRIDLEKIHGQRALTYDVFLRALARKVDRILGDHEMLVGRDRQIILQWRCLQRGIASGRPLLIENALCTLTRAIQRGTGRRLTLIVDNVDYLCHLHDQHIFDEHMETHEDTVITFLLHLIGNFVNHQNEAGQLGANVLFVMRKDTLRLLRLSLSPESHARGGGLFDEDQVFTLRRVDWRVALERRLALLQDEVELTGQPGKKRKFEDLVETINTSLEGEASPEDSSLPVAPSTPKALSGLVVGLAVRGLRELMDFLGDYVWISPADSVGDTLQRFIHKVPIGLLAYVLGGKRLYSESQSRFPNVWVTSLRDVTGRPEQCSYMLKRAIMTFLRVNGNTQVSTIYSVFGERNGYPRPLIQRALLDLGDAQVSRALVIDRERVVGSSRFSARSVRLSDRGILACEVVFRRFFYLQLVVDDPALPVPLCLLGPLGLKPESELSTDYRYIAVTDAVEYGRAARSTIHRKARQVALLLLLLEEIESCEKTLFAGAFARLTAANASPVPIANVRSGVRTELRALARTQPIDVDAVFAAAEAHRSTIRAEITESFHWMYSIA